MVMTLPMTSRMARAAGVSWHFMEAGEGEPVVFLHGLPESWYSWHYQLDPLALDYHVYAVDLKGFGQSDKSDGNYAVEHVAEELLALFDELALDRFTLIGHDWGALIGDHVAGNHPNRVHRYVRMAAPLLRDHLRTIPEFTLCRVEALARALFADAEQFVRMVYGERTVQSVPDHDLRRIVDEFARPGVAEAVPRYFRDLDLTAWEHRTELYSRMRFPVLLLQATDDPGQPPALYDSAASLFPDARLQFIEDAGHFIQIEQPAAVREAILAFLSGRGLWQMRLR
jgi:epoxide hydrolase 4